MVLSSNDREFLIREITKELDAKADGAGKNLIARCPRCGKEGKYGIYVGKETQRKKPFMSHCFSCGCSTYTLEALLDFIGRPDLMVAGGVLTVGSSALGIALAIKELKG